MTNTLTYSTAAGTTWPVANSSAATFGLTPVRFSAPHNPNRSFFRPSPAQFLENLTYLVRHTCDAITDHADMFLLAGIVTGMFGMASALAISLSL